MKPTAASRFSGEFRIIGLLVMMGLAFQFVLPAALFMMLSGAIDARVPICTGAGLVWVDVGGNGASSGTPADTGSAPAKSAGFCPLCSAQGPVALPADADVMATPWPQAGEKLRPSDGPPIVSALNWLSRQSRAPPVFD